MLTRLLVFGAAYAWLRYDTGKLILAPSEPIWHGDPGGHGAAAEPWRRWDALWFIKTARGGYEFRSNAQSNASILPLYPVLIASGAKAGLDPIWAGVLISNLCLFAAVVLLLRLADEKVSETVSNCGAVAMMIYPCAFVLSGVYSESLYLMCTLAAFYSAGARRWLLAGLFGFAAAFTRFTGAVLIIPLALEYFMNRRREESAAKALWLLLIPSATVLFFAYLGFKTGSFANYFNAQLHWQKNVDWPWVGLGWELIPWFWAPVRLINLLNVGCIVFAALLCRPVWRRYGATWGAYMLLGVLIPACSSRWIGMPRYMLVLFPAFIVLADIIKNRIVFCIYAVISTALMLGCFHWFLNWRLSL